MVHSQGKTGDRLLGSSEGSVGRARLDRGGGKGQGIESTWDWQGDATPPGNGKEESI